MKRTTVLKPSPVNIFNKNVLSEYARRLVRKELFLIHCQESHPCVLEEDRLISSSEHNIAELIKQNQIFDPSRDLKQAFSFYVRRLIHSVDLEDTDEETRQEVLKRASTYNVLQPFEIARLEISA